MAIVAAALMMAVPAPAVASLSEDLEGAQRRANQAAAALSRAQEEIAQAEDAVAHLQTRVTDVETRASLSRDRVRDLAVRLYVEGPSPFVRLLRMADANEALRAQQYARLLAGRSTDSLERYRADREDLRQEVASLEAERESQAAALRSLERRRTDATREVDRLARLAQEQKSLAAREEQRRQAATPSGDPAGAPTAAPPPARSTPAAAAPVASSDWVCPVQGPHAFSDDYGAPRGGGARHQGNDILAPRGTPVVASVSGTVSHRGGNISGMAYFLAGDDGNRYFGAHLDSYGASGQVAAGTEIGTVGNTGDAAGGPTHLHFEIHPGGNGNVNPYPTLQRNC